MIKEPLYLSYHKGVISQLNFFKVALIGLFVVFLGSLWLNYYFFEKLSQNAAKEVRLIDKEGRTWNTLSFLNEEEADFLEGRDFVKNFLLHFYSFSKENFDYNMKIATKEWGSKSVQYAFDMNTEKKLYEQVLQGNLFAYVDEKELLENLKIEVVPHISFTAAVKMVIKGAGEDKYLNLEVSGYVNRIPKGKNNPHGMSVVNFEQKIK